MRNEAAIRRTVKAIVRQWIDEGKMFTAFEVSLAAKERGVEERHRDMRDLVHEIIFEIGESEGYTRTLRDVGAPTQAWVYHLPHDNPYEYQPLPRDGKQMTADPSVVLPKGIREPVRLRKTTHAPAGIPAGVFGTDQRGRLCIPVSLLAQLGVGPGNTVHVSCDHTDKKVLITRADVGQSTDADTCYTVEPDGNVRITQATLAKADLDQLQCYFIEGNASEITVRKFAWS